MSFLTIPISPGDFLDKLSILSIKRKLIKNPKKLQNIEEEYKILSNLGKSYFSKNVQKEYEKLLKVNLKLWRVEDKLRKFENKGIFDMSFVELARSVYITNDERAKIKRFINKKLNSAYFEEKSYP